MTITAFPLQWPQGWPRTSEYSRKRARFSSARTTRWQSSISVSEGTGRVLEELRSMRIDQQDIVISTNVRLRLDGMPRSGEPEPEDPGVAVYWETGSGDHRVMAIDQYDRVADNLAAIAATLNAMRAIERHGGAQILDRAFTGFVALPAPGGAQKREWWDVLGISRNSTPEEIKAAYKKMASMNHPDKGGSAAAMAEINLAYQEAMK